MSVPIQQLDYSNCIVGDVTTGAFSWDEGTNLVKKSDYIQIVEGCQERLYATRHDTSYRTSPLQIYSNTISYTSTYIDWGPYEWIELNGDFSDTRFNGRYNFLRREASVRRFRLQTAGVVSNRQWCVVDIYEHETQGLFLVDYGNRQGAWFWQRLITAPRDRFHSFFNYALYDVGFGIFGETFAPRYSLRSPLHISSGGQWYRVTDNRVKIDVAVTLGDIQTDLKRTSRILEEEEHINFLGATLNADINREAYYGGGTRHSKARGVGLQQVSDKLRDVTRTGLITMYYINDTEAVGGKFDNQEEIPAYTPTSIREQLGIGSIYERVAGRDEYVFADEETLSYFEVGVPARKQVMTGNSASNTYSLIIRADQLRWRAEFIKLLKWTQIGGAWTADGTDNDYYWRGISNISFADAYANMVLQTTRSRNWPPYAKIHGYKSSITGTYFVYAWSRRSKFYNSSKVNGSIGHSFHYYAKAEKLQANYDFDDDDTGLIEDRWKEFDSSVIVNDKERNSDWLGSIDLPDLFTPGPDEDTWYGSGYKIANTNIILKWDFQHVTP